jgi:tetratricopeptide (TPR) repeat protein
LEAKRFYEKMEALAIHEGNIRLELAALMSRTTILAVPSSVFNPPEGQLIARRALQLAEQLGDRPAIAKILWNLLLLHFFLNQPEKAAEFGEQAQEIARQENLQEQLAYVLNDLGGFAYLALGEYQKGLIVLEEAISLWKEIGNRFMLSDSLTESAYLSMSAGDLQSSLGRAEQAYELSRSIGNAWGIAYTLGVTGFIRYLRGEVDQAITVTVDSLAYHGRGGFMAAQAINNSLLAVIYTRAGDYGTGLRYAEEAVARAESGVSFWIPGALGSLMLAHLQAGNLNAAAEAIQKITETNRSDHRYFYVTIVALAECEFWSTKKAYDELMRLTEIFLERMRAGKLYVFGPYAAYYRGIALLGKGRAAEGRAALVQARDGAREILLRDAWWRSAAQLAELELKNGDRKAANRLFKEAGQVIQFIAEHSVQSGLRESFLEIEMVKLVGQRIKELKNGENQ